MWAEEGGESPVTHCGSTGLEMPVALVLMAAKPFCLLVTPWPSSLPFCDQLALLAVLDFANSGASGSRTWPSLMATELPWPLPAALEAVNHSCSIGGSLVG